MKQTTHFNINVPELGDRPDITQVSDAISALEDTTSGMPEYMEASIQGALITLSSNTRTTKRTKYYDGLTIMFKSPAQINPNSITRAKVDDLGEQTISIPFLVSAGESLLITYYGSSFTATRFVVAKDSSVASTSSETVATSLAVKTAYDKAVEAYNKAGTVDSFLSGSKADKATQVIAGNGLTGGGDLSTNRTINVVSADDGIVVNQDNIKLNTTDDIATVSSTRPASATAVKKAYDKANEKVAKAGDTMTGDLTLPNLTASGDIFANGTISSTGGVIDSGSRVYSPVNKPTPADIGALSKNGDTLTAGGLNFGGTYNSYLRALFDVGDGIKTNVSGGQTAIRSGYDTANLNNTANIDIVSWNGVSFTSSYQNSTGKPCYVFNTRNGNSYQTGDMYLQSNKRVYHEGFKPSYSDVMYRPVGVSGTTNLDLVTEPGTYLAHDMRDNQFPPFTGVYVWGLFEVIKADVAVIQRYTSHTGNWILQRVSWSGGGQGGFTDWKRVEVVDTQGAYTTLFSGSAGAGRVTLSDDINKYRIIVFGLRTGMGANWRQTKFCLSASLPGGIDIYTGTDLGSGVGRGILCRAVSNTVLEFSIRDTNFTLDGVYGVN